MENRVCKMYLNPFTIDSQHLRCNLGFGPTAVILVAFTCVRIEFKNEDCKFRLSHIKCVEP